MEEGRERTHLEEESETVTPAEELHEERGRDDEAFLADGVVAEVPGEAGEDDVIGCQESAWLRKGMEGKLSAGDHG
jgi:hypothetical protein